MRQLIVLAAFAVFCSGCVDTQSTTGGAKPPEETVTLAPEKAPVDESAPEEPSDAEAAAPEDASDPKEAEPAAETSERKDGDKKEIKVAVKDVKELDKLIAQQEGKVVVVDLWATW